VNRPRQHRKHQATPTDHANFNEFLKIGTDYSPDAWILNKGFDPDKLWGLHLDTAQLDDLVNFVGGFRDRLGKTYDIALELHARYDVETAIQLCRLLEPFWLMWVEDPIPSNDDDVDAMLRVRNNTSVPIATGENICSRYGYREFLEKEAFSIIQPDMSKTEGLLESRKIESMAEVYSIPVAPHRVTSRLATMAYAQVCATIPNLMILEWTHHLNRKFTSLTDRVSLAEGFLEISNKARHRGCPQRGCCHIASGGRLQTPLAWLLPSSPVP